MSGNFNIVVQSYGRTNEYLRAVFTVWSFYVHAKAGVRQTETLIYTDAPEFFEHYLKGLSVTYVRLTPEWMREMRGENDFLHRMKIAIIEDAFSRSSGNLLYVDSDTFFIADPLPLLGNFNAGQSFMHTKEYAFRSLLEMPLPAGSPFHAVVKHMQREEFIMANGVKRKFDVGLFSWNAGVIMIHHSNQSWLADVFAITDQLYASTRSHASEQYAFSLVLQLNSRLESCEGVIYHYWHRIRKQIVDEFLLRRMDLSWAGLVREKKAEQILQWTANLPGYFDDHVLTARDNAIQAFNKRTFFDGYRWTFRALIKKPFEIGFIRDVAYHTRQLLLNRGNLDNSVKVGFCIAYDWHLLAYSLPLIYDRADVICLSVDEDHCSWAQRPFDWDEAAFNDLIRSIDVSGKIQVYKGNFHLDGLTPSENEVRQRKLMSEYMGPGGWHIQLDCDEYFLDFDGFVQFLRKMKPRSFDFNVCCQLVTVFKQVDRGFLYVYPEKRRQSEYIQIASRTPAYEHGRRNGNFNMELHFLIIHQSWARSEEEIANKLLNWGHARDFDVQRYFEFWKSVSEENYLEIRDFHPVKPQSWPSLKFLKSDGVNDLICRFCEQPFPTHSHLSRVLRNSLFVSRLRKGIGSLFKMRYRE